MDLSTATTEQLMAELARRERVSKLPDPVPLPEPDFEPVISLVHAYIRAIQAGGPYPEDHDQYIFEGAVVAVYGPGIWPWVRAKTT